MLESYDSVTPKRRPAIRVMFAALAAGAIFGATASAASVPVVDDGAGLVETSSAAISDPAEVDDAGAADLEVEADAVEPLEEGTLEEDGAVEALAVPDLDFGEIAAMNAGALAQLRQVESLASSLLEAERIETNRALGVDAEPVESLADDEPAEVLDDERDEDVEGAAPIAEQDVPVEVLSAAAEQAAAEQAAAEQAAAEQAAAEQAAAEQAAAEQAAAEQAAAEQAAAEQAAAEQAAAAQQAAGSNANLSVGERAAVLARELGTPSDEAQAQAAWDAGYLLGGGSNLSAFHNTIIPCESGGQPNRDSVVGFTDDWGRAQINRPVWSSTFRDLTGVVFEEGVVLPALNGYMAAHIEQVQGLSAWTCWRNR